MSAAACEHGEVGCGVYYDCGLCARKKRASAFRNLTARQRAYDNYVDPAYAYHENFPEGCSCHISPPCSYCTSKPDEDAAITHPTGEPTC